MTLGAVEFRDVRKAYRLYPSPTHMAVDALGIGRVVPRRWRPSYQQFEALRGVTATIRHGERWAVVGRNGAGKTTLLRLLVGDYVPTSGRVSVDGSVQGLFAGSVTFHEDISGIENVRSGLAYNGLWGDALERAAGDVAEWVELGDFLHRPIRTYSKGMAMRLEFATSTAIEPDILIIDEVLGAGDGYFATKSAERVRQLTDSGCTLLLVSHSLDQVRKFCDHALWLDRGQVIASGPVSEILQRYEESFEEADPQQEARLTSSRGARARRQQHELPESFRSGYLVDRMRGSEPVEPTTEVPVTTMMAGVAVERWPGNPERVVIDDVAVEQQGEPVWRLHTGDAVELRIETRITASGAQAVRGAILVHGVDGELVAGATSPVDRFDGQVGDRRRMVLSFPQLPLGHGDFAVSVGVFDATAANAITASNRLDYLSRAFALRIPPAGDSDPPILHWTGTWSSDDGPPQPTRVSGMV